MNDIKKKGKAEVKNSFYKDLFFLTFGILPKIRNYHPIHD